jgi:hypothetical protein
LSKRPFPAWIKIIVILVGLVFLYALARTPRSLLAAIAFERGQRAEAGGNFATAASEYARAAEIFPNSTLAVARRGIAEYRAGDRAAAVQTLNSIAGRQTSKELTTEVNAVIAEIQSGGSSIRYNSSPPQSSSSDILDRWIAENLPSATPPNSRTQDSTQLVKAGTIVSDVGGTKINIPPPEGFFRLDGTSDRVDTKLRTGLASTNKLLAAFASDADLATAMKDDIPEPRRWFFAQSLISAGYLTDASWTRLKSSLRSDLQADMEKLNSSEFWGKVQSDMASTSKELGMEFGGAKFVPLEVFDEDERSLCYSVLMKSQYRAPDFEKPVTVIQYESAATVCVRHRVIYLYSCAVFEDKSDAEWARASLQHWKDQVVAANR